MTRARELANLGNNTTDLEAINAVYDAGGLTGRNLIINGAMTVDQRNGGSSVTPTADQTYVLDRFGAGLSVASKFSLEQTTTVPAGFKNSMKATVVSAYTPGSAEWFGFFHKVEGLNASHLDFGTSDAKTLTLSFWVRSSVTGDYGFSLANSAQNRAYPVLYNISAADTWEHKTITIAGDTSGTWLTTNGIGLILLWSLGAGSSYLQTANAWGTGLGLGTTGQTNWITNASATFYITGVQLEVGSTATPFEHKSFADDEWDCQRYYHMVKEGSGAYMQFCLGRAWGTGGANAPYKFPKVMRASPTMTAGGAASDYDFALSAIPAAGSVTLNNDMMMINVTGSFTTGQIVVIGSNDVGNGPAALMFDAEL